MKFFAQTVFNHIKNQIEVHITHSGGTGKLLFMMPSIPIKAAIQIGTQLENYCAEQQLVTSPLIKIAESLCQEWEQSLEENVKVNFAKISENEWIDRKGSLTSYRNVPAANDKILPVLLVGVDRVHDVSSLSDFYHCNHRLVWENELNRDFSSWIEKCLKEKSIAHEEESVRHMNEILKALVDRGLADIVQISQYLEELEIAGVQEGRDAENVMLSSLARFGLPVFMGFRFSERKTFISYLDAALSFFSYTTLLEENSRNKALAAVNNFAKHTSLGEYFDLNERGVFGSDEELLDGLKSFIQSGNQEAREKLFACDFIKIQKITDFKKKREKRPRKDTIKKLSGGPVEVLLTALWKTLAEFKKVASEEGQIAHEALREIRIEANLFKHDLDGETSEERISYALKYLKRLLGGVDQLVEDWLGTSKLGGDREIEISSKLFLPDVACQPSRTAEPSLQFIVEVIGDGLEKPVVNKFAWRLPSIEPYRVAESLIGWASESMSDISGYCLPVFHVPYYEELMLASDDEETRRVLLQCIQDVSDTTFDLLSVPDLDHADPLMGDIKGLAIEYDRFISSAQQNGLHFALFSDWDSLRKAYNQAVGRFINEAICSKSPLSTFLFRSFLIVQQRSLPEGHRWAWEPFEESAVVTVLHPALLEMLQAQIQYLLTSFVTLCKHQLRSPSSRAFLDKVWQNHTDLATIQMPLSGLIRDRNKILDTDMRGEDLIHRIGAAKNKEASLTTRLLLQYDAFEEEDVSDAELFRESRESSLICRVLIDYNELHPHAEDGLSISIYNNQDIQPIIAAIDKYLAEVCSAPREKYNKYSLSVTIFTESNDEATVSRWINLWKERWEAAEDQKTFAHYRECHLSVAQRIVSSENYYRQFKALIINGLQVDVAILNDFIKAGSEGNDFQIVEPFDVTSRLLKFPVLEKPFCSLKDPGRQLQRARVLSNRQFRIGTLHSELMARLKNPGTSLGTNHTVLGYGDYTPWQGVVDALHQRAEWVVCIDPNVDERLIEIKGQNGDKTREIIGFGSGVGAHGEANYTISTEQFNLSDVLRKIMASVGEIYVDWGEKARGEVSKAILMETSRLSGLSLVRATGTGQYIRDFMAFALTRKILKCEKEVLCDQLVSLDAYRHWFDAAESDTRPDLVWFVVNLGDDGRLHLDLRLIECKLAKMSEVHLDKARLQLENGLNHLMSVFKPRNDDLASEDDRPDQRYWWLQLYRLIASKAKISGHETSQVLAALERLADGDYEITWQANAITYWTDQDSAEISMVEEWPFQYEGNDINIGVVSGGVEFVKLACSPGFEGRIPWHSKSICFDSQIKQSALAYEVEEVGSEDSLAADHISNATSGNKDDVEAGESSEVHTVQANDRDEKPIAINEIKVLDRILLGSSTQGSRKVYWEFGHPDLSNRHVLIFGASGMGKTYAIQCLLCELGIAGQNSLIIDYTNGFLPDQQELETKKILDAYQHVVRQSPLPISPFRQQTADYGGIPIDETTSTTAKRITSIFQTVYNLGDQQFSILFDSLVQGIESFADDMDFNKLLNILDEYLTEEGKNKSATQTTLSKIRPFVLDRPFESTKKGFDWEFLFTDTDKRCHIFQLAGLDFHTWRLVAEFVLWDLYAYLQAHGRKEDAKVIVLDEVQNLDQKETAPLAKYLREGRKFGVSLILATQTMSNLGKDERDRLFNAGQKLFFRPADTEIKSYASIAAMSTDDKIEVWTKRLASLQKGECYSLGPSLNETTGKLEQKTFKIRITSLKERNLSD